MIIFLDMDGVMFNFIGSLEKHLNINLSDLDQWDIGKHLKRNDIDDVISSLDHDFWANIEPYDNIKEILRLCEYYSKGNVYVCSSPANHPGSFSGKKVSIDKHLPKGYSKRLILMKKKYLLATKDTVLVDDGQYQVFPFQERGGYAVLYPQLWNNYRFIKQEDKVDFLDAQLKIITNR